jgi:hypothetical protein
MNILTPRDELVGVSIRLSTSTRKDVTNCSYETTATYPGVEVCECVSVWGGGVEWW